MRNHLKIHKMISETEDLESTIIKNMEENNMRKLKLFRVLLLSACMVALSSTVALASQTEDKNASSSVVQNTGITNKQIEIDQFLFDTGAKEIEKLGFRITSTLPVDNYVQIGISPYSDANAEFLYNKFGKDAIKVVEEDISIAYSPEIAYTTGAGVAGSVDPSTPVENAEAQDTPLVAESGMGTTSVDDSKAADGTLVDEAVTVRSSDLDGDINPEAADKAANGEEMMAYTTGVDVKDTKSNKAVPIAIASLVGILLVGGAIVIKRKGLLGK